MALRGGLALLCFTTFSLAAGLVVIACGDDDSGATGADGGPDSISPNPTVTPPPPNFPDAPAPPPDLVSRSGFMGNATLVGDVGAPTDGPSWRNADNALYFTVPGDPNPLRRLVPSGTPSVVAIDGGGNFAPVGTASGGGDRLFITERESVVTVDLDDAGAPSAFARTTGLGNTVFGDIATSMPGPAAWFVDTSQPRVYRFVPPNDLALNVEIADSGKTTAIATRASGTSTQVIAAVNGSALVIMRDFDGTLEIENQISTQGIPPNGIAVDDSGRIFVAWAKGIDIFTTTAGTTNRPQDGDAMLPIRAIPTSLTFGGADRKTLFVTTASGKIYSVPVQTPGVLR